MLRKVAGLAILFLAAICLARMRTAWASPPTAPLNQTTPAQVRFGGTSYEWAIEVGSVLTVEVWADPAGPGAYTQRVQFTLGFDADYLTVVDAAGNPTTQIVPYPDILNQVNSNSVDNGIGEIRYDAEDTTPCNEENKSAIKVATIQFLGRAPTTGTPLTFADPPDTVVGGPQFVCPGAYYDYGTLTRGGNVVVIASTPTPTRTATWTPTNTASSTPADTPTPSPSSTATSTPSLTPAPSHTATSTPTPTYTSTAIPTPIPGRGQILGYAFWDINRNGTREPYEPPVQGARVSLQDGTGVEMDFRVTGANGYYEFLALQPNVYRVVEDVPPEGWQVLSSPWFGAVTADSNSQYDLLLSTCRDVIPQIRRSEGYSWARTLKTTLRQWLPSLFDFHIENCWTADQSYLVDFANRLLNQRSLYFPFVILSNTDLVPPIAGVQTPPSAMASAGGNAAPLVRAIAWRSGAAPVSRVALLQATSTPTPDQRFRFGFGIDLNYGHLGEYDVGQLGAGWYSDWYSHVYPPKPACLEYAQLIYCDADAVAVNVDTKQVTWSGWADLEQKIAANPGSIWMVGNEPDCRWPDCDNRLPEEYAIIYHEFYHFIKDRDPTALVANGAIVEGTPLRLQYLDLIWDAYQSFYGTPMPVDVWNMHNQIAREKEGDWGAGIPPGFPSGTEGALYEASQNDSLDIFIQHIVNMRTWMKEHGQRDKPLIISEYGVLFTEDRGFTVDRVNDFMTNTFRYLLYATDPDLGYPADGNRLVQRWLWFSINEPPWKWNGALFDYTVHEYPGVITRYGLNYKAFTSNPYKASPTPQGTPPPETVYREAEGGSLSGDMRIVGDTSASACEYVDTPSGSAGGSVQVSVYIPRSSRYYVWLRVYGPSYSSDSFWVSVDEGTEYVLGTGTGSWRWQRVVDANYAPVAFPLNPGWHRIKVSQREVGARVDVVVISSNSGLAPAVPSTCQTPTPTVSPTPLPSLHIPLQPGWNLVSIPIDVANYDIRNVLASISGSYDIVYAWDSAEQAWKGFFPALPDPQPLQSLSRLQGFWVHMTQADTLEVFGCRQGQASILLNPDWNLVGFPAGAARDVPAALASIAGKYTLVFAYDATDVADPWSKFNTAAPSYANDLVALEPGKGYWVKATQACAWVVPY